MRPGLEPQLAAAPAQPEPARAEEIGRDLLERGREFRVGAEVALDRCAQHAARLARCSAEAMPEEIVVPCLSRVFVDHAFGIVHDLLERRMLEFRPREELVELIEIALVVLAIVIAQRFLRYPGLQRIDRIGQFRQLMFHFASSTRLPTIPSTVTNFSEPDCISIIKRMQAGAQALLAPLGNKKRGIRSEER